MHVLQKKVKEFQIDDILIFVSFTQIITDLKYLLAYSAQSKNLFPFECSV